MVYRKKSYKKHNYRKRTKKYIKYVTNNRKGGNPQNMDMSYKTETCQERDLGILTKDIKKLETIMTQYQPGNVMRTATLTQKTSSNCTNTSMCAAESKTINSLIKIYHQKLMHSKI